MAKGALRERNSFGETCADKEVSGCPRRSVLRELRMLRTSSARRTLSNLAAVTAAGKLGVTALQFRSAGAALATGGLTVTSITTWESWVDELWQQCRREISFCVRRDLRTVQYLYPLDDRVRGYCVRREGRPVGWMSVQTTQMRDHKYFGNLRLSTLLDGMALSGVMQGTISLVSFRLVSEGEDLLVSNPVCACKVTIDRRITNSAVTNTLLPGILEFLVMSFSFLLRVRIAEYKPRSSKMLRPLRPRWSAFLQQ